jgi:hypothetical protein
MVKKEFRIVALEAYPAESVMLTLSPLYSLGFDEGTLPENAEKVIHQSEEEKVMTTGIKLTIQEMEKRGMIPIMADRPHGPSIPMIAILLTKTEYAELGKPTPNEIILLTVTLDREPEPKPRPEAPLA